MNPSSLQILHRSIPQQLWLSSRTATRQTGLASNRHNEYSQFRTPFVLICQAPKQRDITMPKLPPARRRAIADFSRWPVRPTRSWAPARVRGLLGGVPPARGAAGAVPTMWMVSSTIVALARASGQRRLAYLDPIAPQVVATKFDLLAPGGQFVLAIEADAG